MILHFCTLDKFIPPFIELINNEFDNQNHHFLVYGDRSRFPFKDASNVEYQKGFVSLRGNIRKNIGNISRFLELAKKSEKIILHGLCDDNLVKLLFFYPRLLKKSYWIMWGGDLYRHIFREKGIRSGIHEFFRRHVIRRIGHLVTYIEGDYELAKKWYGARGKCCKCFTYTSNFCNAYHTKPIIKNGIFIQLGNSADPSNNHLEILKRLSYYRNEDLKIFVPLSYGNQLYAQKVIEKGKDLFGERFVPLTEFMTYEKYMEFLSTIDIAIFAHKRQQAMGNIVNLLGMGKRVFLKKDVVVYPFLTNLGIKVFDLDSFSFDCLNVSIDENPKIVRTIFSRENLICDLSKIFEGKL